MRRKPTNTRLKTLYVMKFFMENTNKDNIVNTNDVIEYLQSLGIRAERKAIYTDIKVLNQFGIKILKKNNGFYYEAI